MKAYRCDRCGNFFEGFPFGESNDATWMYKLKLILFRDNAANRQVLPITFPKKTTLTTEKETIDLCPHCIKDFAVWLTKTEYCKNITVESCENIIGFSRFDETKEEETT